jgi:hypothetical protein
MQKKLDKKGRGATKVYGAQVNCLLLFLRGYEPVDCTNFMPIAHTGSFKPRVADIIQWV